MVKGFVVQWCGMVPLRSPAIRAFLPYLRYGWSLGSLISGRCELISGQPMGYHNGGTSWVMTQSVLYGIWVSSPEARTTQVVFGIPEILSKKQNLALMLPIYSQVTMHSFATCIHMKSFGTSSRSYLEYLRKTQPCISGGIASFMAVSAGEELESPRA